MRGKPRDLYDVHFLFSRGFAVSRELLALKMTLYGKRFTKTGLDRGIVSARRTWDQDLEPLLGQVPPFRPLADEVRRRFDGILSASE